ncbi:MAG: hypothetical protein ACHQ1D_00410 [Nitrososphaerales archaeon]
MSIWAVIDVDLDYDYCNGLECIGTFSSYEEAQSFIEDDRQRSIQSGLNWHKYRKEYAEKYDNKIEQYSGNDLLAYIKLRKYPDFNPPPVAYNRLWYPVEIKNK